MKQVLVLLSLLAIVTVGCNRNQNETNSGVQQQEIKPVEKSDSQPSDLQKEEDHKQMGSGTQTAD
jgi:Tfp pilus assembly protein PilP